MWREVGLTVMGCDLIWEVLVSLSYGGLFARKSGDSFDDSENPDGNDTADYSD